MAERDKIVEAYFIRLGDYYCSPSVGELMMMVSYLLKHTRMSQNKLAKTIHCSQATISQIMYLVNNAVPEEYTGENRRKSVASVYLSVKRRLKNDTSSFTHLP